jgi:hypothetical protein
MDAVAAPPAKAEIVTRPRPSKTIRSDSASTKVRRFRMRARAASARRKSRQTGSASATMCTIIEQTAADMARLDPSHRECPRLSQPTAETALRRQSMSVTFQPMPPRESTVGSPARLGTRLAGCTLPRSNGPWRVEKRRFAEGGEEVAKMPPAELALASRSGGLARRRVLRDPPEILLTTPESLEVMFREAKAAPLKPKPRRLPRPRSRPARGGGKAQKGRPQEERQEAQAALGRARGQGPTQLYQSR